ncbi:MAG: hypothetical protein LBF68_06795 [Christensenellaceae bacterium]|nr:hypothetical protein [Christensenellaceae bacterium]
MELIGINLFEGKLGSSCKPKVHDLYNYQQEAVDRAPSYYVDIDRGKMIMACGTGKALISLRITKR